jgi:hypothetical protein
MLPVNAWPSPDSQYSGNINLVGKEMLQVAAWTLIVSCDTKKKLLT